MKKLFKALTKAALVLVATFFVWTFIDAGYRWYTGPERADYLAKVDKGQIQRDSNPLWRILF